uniref:Hydroxyproline-rich glycoprotein family protein n=1 Tax=Davidia involucrata TaxID=16924 RepID=A0A5B6YV01_DAVIN
MRRVNGDMRGVNNTLETINAAATAIASAENRMPHASVQKRRWGGCWSINWCFGPFKHNKRIGHAILVPETTTTGAEVPAAENPTQAPAIVLPFVAPPSSPASFLQSEPPSATQSPPGLLSLTSISANMYSPGGPASIFAIGPYAHETQLVSPPVFSTFTTEPSTAPFTPPPESVQFTTPSSPEVPFARLLDPNYQNGEACPRFPLSHYEFQSYQLYPGSPVGHLISPSSGISGSGTSSPFPDREFAPGGPHFLEFRTGDPPKLLNLDKLPRHEWGSRQGSGSLTPDAVGPRSRGSFLLDRQNSDVAPLTNSFNGWRNDETAVDHRVSFEITPEVVRCVEKKPAALAKAVSASLENAECVVERDENSSEMPNGHECPAGETSNDTPEKAIADGEGGQQHQKHRSITLGSGKEFNFDNADGGNSDKHNIGSDWWANEKVLEKEVAPTKNWTFFPMMQSGVS